MGQSKASVAMGQDRQSLRLAGPGPDIPLQLGREQPGLIHIGGSPDLSFWSATPLKWPIDQASI
jgi:hypothetical protein